ncbi:hypothetical protein GFY24_39065 [Nocardia sp. SYP-A9097]|uniref:hypothetical protein n=1 Tax=Nocardia sp. SYP-A9097 TaxID=2663237 RepID=UPI00129A441B|nr:hypothetical protein [Nocardia sp. SYP-A9097]MRH93351.1 hypothetical protein [Nocardia sp. SYP-A9097]
MRSPDHPIGPDNAVCADIDDAHILTGTIDGEPVLILLTRFRVAQIAQDGALVSGDVLESAVRAHGAAPMTDIDFDRAPVAAGWRAVIDARRNRVLLIAPDEQYLHIGDLACEPAWYQYIAERQREGRGLIGVPDW